MARQTDSSIRPSKIWTIPTPIGPVPRWPFLTAGGLAIALCYAVALRAPAVGVHHDDGVYAVTAKSLAEGSGYRIISLPNEIPQTKYPLLFPLALSIVWRIAPDFPENALLLKMVPLAATLMWCLLVFILIRREVGSATSAAGIAGLTVASPHVIVYSTALFAESLFAAFAWAGLILLRRQEEQGASNLNLLWAAVLCAAAFHTRTIGFTLIIAGAAALALRAGARSALKFGTVGILLMVPWIAWVLYQDNPGPGSYAYYTSASYGSWNVLFAFDWEQKLTIVGWNLLYAMLGPAWLMGLNLNWLWPLMLCFGILAVLGFVSDARRDLNVLHVFMVLYVATVIVWAWTPTRFLVPVYPLLLLFAWRGARFVLPKIAPGRAVDWVGRGAVVALALIAGWGLGHTAYAAAQLGAVCSGGVCSTSWDDIRSMHSYLRGNTPPDALLMGSVDPQLYLFTGRKAIRSFEWDPYLFYYTPTSGSGIEPFGRPDALAERIAASGADYLISLPSMTRRDSLLNDQVSGLRREHPGALRRIWTGSSEGPRVYEIDPSRLTR
ncbi:MAG TPA: hypothetical protein VM737_10410 [Gemmatimonadota bacterium]|nr:hypothetical protein [Gemmatimonadota bacterium]